MQTLLYYGLQTTKTIWRCLRASRICMLSPNILAFIGSETSAFILTDDSGLKRSRVQCILYMLPTVNEYNKPFYSMINMHKNREK